MSDSKEEDAGSGEVQGLTHRTEVLPLHILLSPLHCLRGQASAEGRRAE